MKHEILRVEDLKVGEMRSAVVAGTPIVVIRLNADQVVGYRDVCPHLGAKLSLGKTELAVDSDTVGEYFISDNLVFRCPWHGHEFYAENGKSVGDPHRIRVRSIPLSIEDGNVVYADDRSWAI